MKSVSNVDTVKSDGG